MRPSSSLRGATQLAAVALTKSPLAAMILARRLRLRVRAWECDPAQSARTGSVAAATAIRMRVALHRADSLCKRGAATARSSIRTGISRCWTIRCWITGMPWMASTLRKFQTSPPRRPGSTIHRAGDTTQCALPPTPASILATRRVAPRHLHTGG